MFKQAITSMLQPLQQKFDMLGGQVWEVAKTNGLESFWMDETAQQQVADLYAEGVHWNEKEAYLSALSDDEKGSPWVKAIRDGRLRSIIFYYQLSQTPSADRLALTENGKALLQFATLSAMNLDTVLFETAKEKESKLTGEALRLSLMGRLYRHVRSRSFEHIKAARALFLMKGFDDESREEERILKIAEEHERRYTEMVAKAQADADAAAKAKAQEEKNAAKVKTQANAASKERGPASGAKDAKEKK